MSDINIHDKSAHFFCYCQDAFHWLSAVPKRFKRNINEELHQAIGTNSDIKVGKDRISKKYLDAGYPRNFIHSLLKSFDDLSTH